MADQRANLGGVLLKSDESAQTATLCVSSSEAGLTLNQDGSQTSAAGITVTAGGLTATAGGLTATAGNITATAGDIIATAGKIDATNLYTDKVSITLAEMIDLVANPKTLVAAQGANTVIEFVGATFKLNYGSAAFTESADNLVIKYVNGSGKSASAEIETTSSWLVATADAYGTAIPAAVLTASAAEAANVPLVLANTNADFGGGTGSTVDCWITYRVHDVS